MKFLFLLFFSCFSVRNKTITKDDLPLSQEEQELNKAGFIWPVPESRRVTSHFNAKRKFGKKIRIHKGLDIGPNKNGLDPRKTPIVAAKDGVVIFSGRMNGYGKIVIVKHFDSFITIYAHNSLNLVKKGDHVYQGDKIAYMGSTGRSTGPHLHFEMRKNEEVVDPLAYIESESDAI